MADIFPLHPWPLVVLIAYVGTQFATRIQLIILGIAGFSLFAIFLGSFPIAAHTGLTETPELWGRFSRWAFWRPSLSFSRW